MKSSQKVYLINIIAKIAPQSVAFLIGVLLTRELGVEEYGNIMGFIILSQIVYFSLSSAFITNYLREVTTSPTSLNNVVILIIKIGVLFYFPFLIFTSYGNGYEYGFIITLFWLTSIFMQMFNLYGAYLRIQNKDSLLVLVNTSPYILLIFLLASFKNYLTILHIGGIYFISWLIPLIVFYKTKRIPLPKINDWNIYSKTQLSIILCAKVLILNTIFTQINANADQVLLKSLIDSYALGYYRISFVVSNLLMPIIGAFSFIYITKLKNVTKLEQLNFKFTNHIKLNMTLVSVFIIFIFYLAEYILLYVYKIADPMATKTLQILPLGLLFNAMAQVVSYSLLFLKRDRIILYSLILSSSFNVLLNIALVPTYGAVGCAIISVTTQIINFIFLYSYYKTNKANDIISLNHIN